MTFVATVAQERLRAKGLYAGKLDGIFGPGSWAAFLAATAGRRAVTQLDRDLGEAMASEAHLAGIVSALQMAHFVAEGAVETGGFARLVENLNYSAERMCAVWPTRFPNLASARPYAGKPEALANKVYGGRLGNTAAGDGWRYRGRGLFQLTGKVNYAARERDTGLSLVANPDLAADPAQSVVIACRYWRARGIGMMADRDDLTAVRKAVQGGAGGLSDARIYLTRAKAIVL